MKRRSWAVIAVAVTLTASACGSASSGTGEGDGGAKTYTVAQIRWEAGDIFFNGVSTGEDQAIKDIESADGVKINLKTVAANDAGEQLNGLQQLITSGIDGVSLVPWRGESMVSVLKQLDSQGIPVVVHNLIVPGQKQPFVAFDNVKAGELAGKAMLAAIEKARGADWASQGGTIVILRGDITASFDKDRFAGYMSQIQPVLDANPKVKLAERAGLGYQGEPARGAVADALTSAGKDKVLGIGSVDGTMAVGGAIPALKTGGAVVGNDKPNAVAVTSIDCSQAELDSIAAGELTHCSEQPALAEGILVMNMLYDMMKNGTTTPSDGVENIDGWDGKPWMPIEKTTRDDIAGTWYKTQAFPVPGPLPLDSAEHWAVASGATGN